MNLNVCAAIMPQNNGADIGVYKEEGAGYGGRGCKLASNVLEVCMIYMSPCHS